jgi:hypothetical protein
MLVLLLNIEIEGEGVMESTMKREILCFFFWCERIRMCVCVCMCVALVRGCFETELQEFN